MSKQGPNIGAKIALILALCSDKNTLNISMKLKNRILYENMWFFYAVFFDINILVVKIFSVETSPLRNTSMYYAIDSPILPFILCINTNAYPYVSDSLLLSSNLQLYQVYIYGLITLFFFHLIYVNGKHEFVLVY